MTFLPIVERELRVASRRGATYWTRGMAALAALGAGVWIYIMTYRQVPKETGMFLLVALTVLANLYALLASLRTTADCLSEEKREGTLGLLFLTDLRGYDIVLGKLAATSLSAFYALLAMFPIMGLSLLLGGVTPAEFGRIILASGNSLLFSLAAGMLCSALSRDERKAAVATFLLVLCITALPLLGLGVAVALDRRNIHPFFQLPSPAFTVFAAFDQVFGKGRYAPAFYVSWGLVHALAWLFLASACLVVRRAWQDRPGRAADVGVSARLRHWQYGPLESRKRLRARLLEWNPVLWLTSRERFKQSLVFAGLGGLAGIWFWCYAEVGRDWVRYFSIPSAFVAHGLLKIWLSNESCRRFAEDRRSGALELLLATPLAVEDILRGQRLALWRQFAWPAIVVLAVDCLFLSGGLTWIRSEVDVWVGVWLAGMVMLVWDLLALSWVGPWMALNSRSALRASMAALVRICLLPWVLYGLGAAVLAVLDTFLHLHSLGRWEPWGFVGAWFVLSAALNVLFAGWAAWRLCTGFREIATRRFDAPPRYGEWGRVLGEWLRRKQAGSHAAAQGTARV